MAFEIVDGVLKKCILEDGITELTIPEGVTTIGYDAFRGKKVLTKLTFPDSLTEIGDWTFHGCESLKEIVFGKGLKEIGYEAFSSCTSLTELVFPESLERIGMKAFDRCKNLARVQFNNGLKTIVSWAFSWCGLEEVTVPESVEVIEYSAFENCSNLKQVTFLGILREGGNNMFGSSYNMRVIKLHPDDPAIRRKYCQLDTEIAMQMLYTGDCSLRVAREFKFPLLILRYLHTKDAETKEVIETFLKKNFSKLAKESITAGDLPMIEALTSTDAFVTKRNIGKLIQQAVDENKPEIEACLNEYKNKL